MGCLWRNWVKNKLNSMHTVCSNSQIRKVHITCWLLLPISRWPWRKQETSDHWMCLEVERGTSVSFISEEKSCFLPYVPAMMYWGTLGPKQESQCVVGGTSEMANQSKPLLKKWVIVDICCSHGSQVNTPFCRRANLSAAEVHCLKVKEEIRD